jgi:hypothetical protein
MLVILFIITCGGLLLCLLAEASRAQGDTCPVVDGVAILGILIIALALAVPVVLTLS